MNLPPNLLTNLTLALLYTLLNATFIPVNFIQNRRNITRNLSSHWDAKLPYWEWFFIPYFLGLLIIIASPIVFAFLLEPEMYKSFIVTLSLTFIIDLVFWIFWPCKMIKTEKNGPLTNSHFVQMLLSYGKRYGDYNSFPSSHVTQVTAVLFWLCFLFPALSFLWVLLMIVNALSILLTHQHYVADAISGGVIATLVFFMVITFIR